MRSPVESILAAAILCVGSTANGQATRIVVGDGIVRYDASLLAQLSARPSHALIEDLPDVGLADGGLPGQPSFGTESGRRRVRVDLPDGASLYGTGLVTGPLERTGERTNLFNTDAPGWIDSNESLYQSHPWVLAVNPDGSATGILFDTIAETEIDTTGASGFDIVARSEQFDLPVYVVNKPSPQQVVTTLADLTGKPPLPPLWALGYQQSKGSYTTSAIVVSIAEELRERRIPADVVWIDVGYTDGFRMFTWDPFKVPNPSALHAFLSAEGFNTVTSLGGFIRLDPSWPTYHEVASGGLSVRLPDGTSPYVGDVWPGPCIFIDPLNAAARDWYADRLSTFLLSSGVSGAWIDLNEPAVFNGPNKTMPNGNIHLADADLGGTDDHDYYHNAYGMQLSRAADAGQRLARPDKRPFTLSRASFLGAQRYTWTWTGDNRASWYHVDVTIPQALNLGLSAQPYSGPDIGGYLDPIDAQMYRRWMGIGTMLPFCRQHTAGDESPNKEPWVFGEVTERTSRLAIQRRYRLLPHLYTLADEASTLGLPIVRPLFFADPPDASLRETDDAFLLGDGLVVAAATSPSATPQRPDLSGREVRFGFRELDAANSPHDTCDPDLPHLYLRGGHIVPFHDRILQSTKDGYGDALGLIIAIGDDNTATGTLYEDAGDGFGYESGDYLRTTYKATRSGDFIALEILNEEGLRPRPTSRELTLRILLADGLEHRVTVEEPTANTPTVITGVPPESPSDEADPCAAPPPDAIDGEAIPGDAIPGEAPNETTSTQTEPTGMGDNRNELNQLSAQLRPEGLTLGLTANLATDATLLVFLDANPTGAEVLGSAGLTSEPNPIRSLPGTRFDPGFAPDALLAITNEGNGTFEATLYKGLSGAAPAEKIFLGTGIINSRTGTFPLAPSPTDPAVLIAYNDTNTAGVTASSAANAATATTGIECFLPSTLIERTGPPCAPVRVLAALAFNFGFVGDQLLPPAASGLPAQAPNLASIPGPQFLELLDASLDLEAPAGIIDAFDLLAFVTAFEAQDPSADYDNDGDLTPADVMLFITDVSLCSE